ncbi:hypothetical protein [Zoogloea sp.]|uniref:DarT1-associated NADAR antitoxin family protein n=1 Tax=Zoogloea sp. TaxID=49181 RepID=UPI002617D38F|nr:hypothetical protein [Zoogloea sp.]MDD3353929.1 hypothetical protein [Zoogloea sp.]
MKKMANRPIYVPNTSGSAFVITLPVEFEWYPGLAPSQKKKSIKSLHDSALVQHGIAKALEVSSKSESPLGVQLSAFNLLITTQKVGRTFSVECAYQSSKVFGGGGPYLDLLDKSSREAKKDPRLTSSGSLKGFSFFGTSWELDPLTAFYDWLYINALKRKPEYWSELDEYQGFTDIEFNPDRSINCQAYSVALFCSFRKRGLLDEATSSKENFLAMIKSAPKSNARQNELKQPGLAF